MAEKVRAIDGREDRVFFVRDLEVRKDAQGKPIGVKGHAAVWEQRAWIGPPKYGFSEQFQNGAFTESVNGGADVRYLFNHNPDHVLARTKSGTLRLGNDTTGLTVDGDLAPTSVGRDLAILMERGDVDQMSVGMQVVEDRWEEVEGDDGNVYELRTIIRALPITRVSCATRAALPSSAERSSVKATSKAALRWPLRPAPRDGRQPPPRPTLRLRRVALRPRRGPPLVACPRVTRGRQPPPLRPKSVTSPWLLCFGDTRTASMLSRVFRALPATHGRQPPPDEASGHLR
jgi:HK97 family phage prohead protease